MLPSFPPPLPPSMLLKSPDEGELLVCLDGRIRKKPGEHICGAHVIMAPTLKLVPPLLGTGDRAKGLTS